MAVVASAAGTGVSRSHWLTRLRGWHPEWWVYAVAALAWLDLVLMAVAQLNRPAAEGAIRSGQLPAEGLESREA